MRISIITVVYNEKDKLEKTIKSVISQTYKDIEYIVIDGGSTDGTLDIIKKYEDKIDYWISEKDRGIYDAMNKGIKVASGDFIMFLNAGDVFLGEKIVENLVNNIKDLDKYYFSRAKIISDKEVGWIYPGYDVKDYKRWVEYSLPNHQTMLFPRKFYKDNLYDLRFKIGGDDDYKLRAKKELEFEFIDILSIEFKRDGISSNHGNIKLLKQRIKESFIKNYKHKKYGKIPIDPFKLILMYSISKIGEEKFLKFIKFVVKVKNRI